MATPPLPTVIYCSVYPVPCRFLLATFLPFLRYVSCTCAAATRAIGTRNDEQETSSIPTMWQNSTARSLPLVLQLSVKLVGLFFDGIVTHPAAISGPNCFLETGQGGELP